MTMPAFLTFLWEKVKPFKDKWVSPFSFLIAVFVHLLIVSLGTTHYIGASSHPERSNQAVQKLEQALKKKEVRFVYVKDLDQKDAARRPDPEAPFSDRDRAGASPDGKKGTSWDPSSKGNVPQRQFGGQVPQQTPPRIGGPVENTEKSRSQKEVQPQKSIAEKVIKEAKDQKEKGSDKSGGIEIKTAKDGLPVKGEGGKGALGQKPERPSGLTSQLGEMMVQSLNGGFHNPNASRLNQGAVSFETSGWDLGPYARIVQEKVESNWRTPAVQEILRQKGWVAIHFDIMKDGKVENVEISRSSRIPSYDQAAVNALLASNPFPPLPSQVTVEKISGTFRFFYNMWTEEEESSQ
jgi:TonB family protein